jgi:hypothetical protein
MLRDEANTRYVDEILSGLLGQLGAGRGPDHRAPGTRRSKRAAQTGEPASRVVLQEPLAAWNQPIGL